MQLTSPYGCGEMDGSRLDGVLNLTHSWHRSKTPRDAPDGVFPIRWWCSRLSIPSNHSQHVLGSRSLFAASASRKAVESTASDSHWYVGVRPFFMKLESSFDIPPTHSALTVWNLFHLQTWLVWLHLRIQSCGDRACRTDVSRLDPL
jgi:hypothetical protein